MHYLDLPLLAGQPAYEELEDVLVNELGAGEGVRNFDALPRLDSGTKQWLARLAAAELAWLGESRAETLRNLAAQRLAVGCGVTAPSARTRHIDLGRVEVQLFEPGMTEDHLGRMTWGSSLVLSQRLARCPALVAGQSVFELGAGTGLCGITAALVGAAHVDLTDLPDIVPNLRRNVEENRVADKCAVFVYDWAAPAAHAGADVTIVSDPVYSRDHPPLLLNAIRQVHAAALLLQLPLRRGFEAERRFIWDGLAAQGYVQTHYEEEQGRDLFGEQTFAFSSYVWKATSDQTAQCPSTNAAKAQKPDERDSEPQVNRTQGNHTEANHTEANHTKANHTQANRA